MFYAQPALTVRPVAVRHVEGLVHKFLVLRSLEGKVLAEGDLIQTADGIEDRANYMFVSRMLQPQLRRRSSRRVTPSSFSSDHTD